MSRLPTIRAAVVLTTFALQCLEGTAQDRVVTPIGEPTESYVNAARVSATPISGVQFAGRQSPEHPVLSAYVPASWYGKEICVRLMSGDGRYVFEQRHQLGKSRGEPLLSWRQETSYSDKLKNYGAGDMAVRVSKEPCEQTPTTFAVAGWNVEEEEGKRSVRLLVNSLRADEAYLLDRKTSKDYPCTGLRDGALTAFDVECPLPPSLLAAGEALTFEVNRIRRGTPDATAIITIAPIPPE